MISISDERFKTQTPLIELANQLNSRQPIINTLSLINGVLYEDNKIVEVDKQNQPFHLKAVKAFGIHNPEYTQELQRRPKKLRISEGALEIIEIHPIGNTAPRRGGSRHEVTFAQVTFIDSKGDQKTEVMALKYQESLANSLSELMNGIQVSTQ